MTTQKQSALQTIEEKKSLIVGIADKVWEFAELSLQEFKSAETYCEALEKEGFDVERGTCNIETAFAASYGHGRPYIGILAEYDALSGLSQEGGLIERKEKKAGGNGHGCGHNLLGAGAFAAALGIKAYLEQNEKHSKDNTQNKTIRIIVSGGQGPGEDISEAQAMKDYLCAHGIEASRIFMEAQSTDTEKNIAYSARFIPDKNAKIGVVSNDFHLFRAGMLVRAKGFHNVSTIAARSDEVLFLNYRVREYFGVLKDLFGVKFFHFIGE